MEAAFETLSFMRSAKTRIAQASGHFFSVATDVSGDQVLLGVPLTTTPGHYAISVSFTSDTGEERASTLQITVEPFATPTVGSAPPPVVLLDGWQVEGLAGSCPMSNDSSRTFGNLQAYLSGAPNYVPTVYFFENCTECPNCTLEQLGADLGTFLDSLHYSDGSSIPQVDVIAHSMGGLIVRSYLSGKQETPGAFHPPAIPKIRKSIFLATPHFGSFQADSPLAQIVFGKGTQPDEMKRGSQFLWDLATWNQFGEDLRGTDALAVIGNAGIYNSLAGASDGVISITSGSLDFVRPGRTRIVNYCHVPLAPGFEAGFLGCTGTGIANIDTPSHQTYQIISSFLLDGAAWQNIGTAPAQDPYLSKNGGMVVADVNASDQYVTPSSVTWDATALTSGAAGDLFYDDLVLAGKANFALGATVCGPYTEAAGIYAAVRCKSSPAISSVGPLLPGIAKIVQAATTVTITGSGFGAQLCSACSVTASNPSATALPVVSWSDTAISALLPSGFTGFGTIAVTTANGLDAINIIAGAVTPAPAISLSKSSVIFAFTIGATAPSPQTVAITNTGGGSFTYSVAANQPWLNVAGSGSAITVSVNPAGLTANTYQGAITILASGASNSPQTISVTLGVAGTAQPLSISHVSNSATGLQGPVAPGELVSIMGTGLGPTAGVSFSVNSMGAVDSTLAGTRVFFGSVAAPLTYTSSTQINAIVPYEMAGQTQVTMRVEYLGVFANQTIQLANASPGIFTLDASGTGPAAALNQDGTINGPLNPAPKGSYVTIYFTGGGETAPSGVTGSITGLSLKWLTLPVSVTVGGRPANVIFDGAAPALVDGVDQLNVQLSPDTPSGPQSVIVAVGGIFSPPAATIIVQ